MTDIRLFPCTKHSITQADLRAVQESFSQEQISCGTITKAFEMAIAKYCNVEYAVSFTSASTALDAAFHAAKVSNTDRCITTPNTFIATVAPMMRRDLKPYFIDLEQTSGNLSYTKLKELLSHHTPPSRGRWIFVPMHFSGIALDLRLIDHLFRTPDVLVIEDATHALGANYPSGEKIGSCCYSQMTILSFDPTMAITTGQGGMVTTNDPKLYHRLLTFRNNGIEPSETAENNNHEIFELGGNYHITEMQAALGLSQLERLDHSIEKRRQLATCYRQYLSGSPVIQFFNEQYDATSAHHFMTVKINFTKLQIARSAFMKQLREMGVSSQLHYTPIYRLPVFTKKYGDCSEQFPEMEEYYQTALSLPLYYDLEASDVEHICKCIRKLIT